MQEHKKRGLQLSTTKKILDEAGVQWLIFAGAATFAYGSKREITNVDILVKCEDLNNAKAALEGVDTEGFDIVCGGRIETKDGKCEFFLDDEMIKRRNWKRLFDVEVPVISVEDNIVFKAILQRGKEQKKHDFEDIQAMLASQKIDIRYLRKRIKKCHAEKRVKPLLKPLVSETSKPQKNADATTA